MALGLAEPWGILTAQIGVSGGWTAPWGISISLFAGLVFDDHGHVAFYRGYGGARGVGSGLSGGLQISYTNGYDVCSVGGPFVNGSSTVAVGGTWATIDVYTGAGKGPSGAVGGVAVTLGGGGGASASAGVTSTKVHPIGQHSCK